jgi:sugar lactone lactonase YvrE
VLDAGNNWLVTEQGNNRLRRVAHTTQIVTTVAGTGTAGFNGDNVAATVAQVNVPSGVAVDQAGHVFIADTFNHRVRRVDAVTGEITTVAGNGSAGPLGDGASATAAQLNFPLDVAVDGAGNVLIADSFNNRVRRVDAITGVITTVAGNGMAGYAGDGAAATAAQLDFPVGIALDADQDILIADGNNHAVRLVNRTSGAIATIAGTGIAGYNGDNQAAATALIDSPYRLAVEPSGTVLLTEAGGMRVRRIGQ